jgi:ADP-heptose:LPS heptosyltransferase
VGDFILALPLIDSLCRRGPVTLVTRSSYAALISSWPVADWVNIDGAAFAAVLTGDAATLPWLAGATVYSFLPDADGSLAARLCAAGAAAVRSLPSRPVRPPHVVVQIAEAAGIPLPPGWQHRAPLARAYARGRAPASLWLHLGSGAATKNVPARHYAAIARASAHRRLVVSEGEADGAAVAAFCAQRGLPAVNIVRGQTLPALAALLATEAAVFHGNDTGITHLAAALGIRTHVWFTATNPRVWAPLGPDVRALAVGRQPTD